MRFDLKTLNLKDLLAKLLPSRVWVGFNKHCAQPAALKYHKTDDCYDYEITNAPPTRVPGHEKWYASLSECQEWVSQIVRQSIDVMTKTETYQKILNVEENVNQYFRYEFFSNCEIATQNYDVLNLLPTDILREIITNLGIEIQTHQTFIKEWLSTQKLWEDVNHLPDESIFTDWDMLDGLIIEPWLQTTYPKHKVQLDELWKACTMSISDTTPEFLSDLGGLPLISCIKFLDQIKAEKHFKKQYKLKRQKMQDRWARFGK